MASINAEYAVFVSNDDIFVQKIASPDEKPRWLPLPKLNKRSASVVALCPTQSNFLAVSNDHEVIIIDLITDSPRSVIPGNGRTITALCWSTQDARVLSIGSIDGSICLWNLYKPVRPLRRLVGSRAASQSLEFSPTNEHLLASLQCGTICIWNLERRNIQPLRTIVGPFDNIAWQPGQQRKLAVVTSIGELRIYSIDEVESGPRDAGLYDSSDEDDDDYGAFGPLDDLGKLNRIVSSIRLIVPLRTIRWINERCLLAQSKDSHEAFVYKVVEGDENPPMLWSCTLKEGNDTISVQNGLRIMTLGPDGVDWHDLPSSVTELVDSEHNQMEAALEIKPVTNTRAAELLTNEQLPHMKPAARAPPTMKPIALSLQGQHAPAFAKTSRQLQQRRLASRSSSPKRGTTAKSTGKPQQTKPSTPSGSQSMNSSLELPKPSEDEFGSPMPFLSPSIPSQRPSPNGITPLEESVIRLPSSSIPSTAATASDASQSDDSDDETFVDGMQGSATFLPGGINVPLPKACGALFAPNGQLLTYFPPKPKLASARGNVAAGQEEETGQVKHISKTAKLFPMFGNLVNESQRLSDGSGSDDSVSFDGRVNGIDIMPSFALQSSSFPSQQSWTANVSPTKQGFDSQRSQSKVVVGVYEIDDVPSAPSVRRRLAEEYRLLRDVNNDEPGSSVCKHNALAAGQAGLHDTAKIWELLAMLLDDQVPLELLAGIAKDSSLLTVVQRAKRLTRSDSGVDLAEKERQSDLHGKLRWNDDPLGNTWLVKQIFHWAEERSDTQLLACVSAVLAESTEGVPIHEATVQQSFSKKLPASSCVYFTDSSQQIGQATTGPRPIPVLRTKTATSSLLIHESPTKPHRSSNTSSRNPSQPPTPYLQSTSSTPPLSLPAISRQGTRQSASGSASPEYHRSSFSAAAKYYAQSISDKFASYGTSPPVKKLGTSPSNSNEISSSLPSGSWSKSVSFASSAATANTARGSLLSRSYDGQNVQDGYDSDKTIEDRNMPYIPRSPSGPVSVMSKNRQAFDDDYSGGAKTKLIPHDMTAKCYLWCQYYAEQLRFWSLLEQAAELAKIAGIVYEDQIHAITPLDSDGMLPTPNKGLQTNSTCSVCQNVARGLQQVCPSCLHISHLKCLQEYIEVMNDEEFTCPTSCGCSCSGLAFVVQEPQQKSPQARPVFKKKASFTDPRRWRARVEGDSW